VQRRHRSAAPAAAREEIPSRPARPDDGRAIDPICGMSVDIATAKHTLEMAGEMLYFCCPHCKARYAKAHA
jgi:xanthine dehydrogenase accessory factor